ncbi:Catenin-beta-like protein [Camillea tinctor]|nr:Catenin-beta-like protein [Camillea tinctor]
MTSIDELFKASGVGNKRKLEPLRDPNEVYKAARLNGHSNDSNASRHARVDDEAVGNEDIEAGPAPPPEDEDYGPELPPDDGDDEDGRFFGGGITAQETEVLDYVDGNDDEAAPEKIDTSWLRKTALNFEKRITKNAELRARFENDPQKFIASEADLDADIKALSILSEHPDLYPEFARLGCVASLVSLLAHENTDIAIDAIEIINELTDEDVAAEEEQWNALVDALLEADLLGLLVSNFERLDETQEVDRSGVYYAMSIVENLCGRVATAEQVADQEKLLKWLLRRIQAKEATVGQNKQYAAELLAILVQTSPKNRRKLASLDVTDIMLQLVAAYRKRDPEKGGEEEEYMENLFEALTCIVDEPEGKTKFVEAEGIELCLIMLKEGKLSKPAALRLLDHAAGGGPFGAPVCLKIVEAGGLKNIFTLFMKKKSGSGSDNRTTTEHLIGLFASMLRLLPADSPERIRTLAKFVEKDYEKTERLVQLRRDHVARLATADEAIRAEQESLSPEEREDRADEWFSRRLDAGLFALQTLDLVLAWLAAEDAGARVTIEKLLADRDETLGVVRESLREQRAGIEADDEDDQGRDTREMLSTLIECLQ